MEKIQSWLESFKSFFSSEITKISDAQAQLATVSAELATAKTQNTAHEATIADLNTKLQSAQETANTLGTENKNLKAEVETEKNRATEALAAQNIDPAKLPPGGEGAAAMSTEKQIDALRAKIAASTDGKEKYALSNQIRELLSKKN